ncbi:pyruvate phosphate dikinase [Firmicutes bacterium CAG:822]|nr:pyruvate phosphate dikinase [Firmicutes bacterium CAG:822]
MKKYVYLFDEGNKDLRNLLGGKGANLAEMTNMGLPVPYGLTVTTEACNLYFSDGELLNENVQKQILKGIKRIEEKTGKKLGDENNPLLLSVRSGSPISMPGMMDTILNLGLNDKIASALAKDEDSKRFIYDSYRRLIMMFADVVKGKGKDKFEEYLTKYKEEKKVKNDLDLTANDMVLLTETFKALYKKLVKEEFPQEPLLQLMQAVTAVFRSWHNKRAEVYRQMNNIPDTLGTAVNVQEMVYGNLSEISLTGVAFSRNPANGEDKLYGEYLVKAQGEDIVAGVRTPLSIDILEKENLKIYNELKGYSKLLEKHYKDMQDMEFTVENGKLYMLQTRNGKRTPVASLNIAIDMANEKLITQKEALMRLDPKEISGMLHKSFDMNVLAKIKPMTKGLPASPGAVSGQICFNTDEVKEKYDKKISTILVREETSPEDIEAMKYANGILTVRGGMTSHAAVVARGIGKCCISGCENAVVDEKKKIMTINGKQYSSNDYLSLDGTTGNVYEGVIETTDSNLSDNFLTMLEWAKKYKKLGVRANADVAKDAKVALDFGAEGIGLCRTEHMFFEKDKIFAIRKMIVAPTEEERISALTVLLKMQEKDFEGLFKAANGKILTIRYLDPPLHEFLPKTEDEVKELATSLNMTVSALHKKIDSLKEFNPMMGLRGCRLSIVYPEIAVMQTTAIFKAAKKVMKLGINVKPEIMIPLVGDVAELKYLKDIILNVAKRLNKDNEVKYKIGTMIEVPRSVTQADEIAKEADFFSFGTNDLTQMTFGYSRDDAGSFINDYYQKGILKFDPFKTIDKEGVGKLMMVAIKLARAANKNIELGVCGEHGGDEESVKFFNKIGLDYVSCSPYRVPVAILAAAQAEIGKE